MDRNNMAEKHKEESSYGCGIITICVIADIVGWIRYWDKITQLEYWPCLMLLNIVLLVMIANKRD